MCHTLPFLPLHHSLRVLGEKWRSVGHTWLLWVSPGCVSAFIWPLFCCWSPCKFIRGFPLETLGVTARRPYDAKLKAMLDVNLILIKSVYVMFVLRTSRWIFLGFHCGSAGKESTCNVGDLGLIPGLGRSPGESTQSIILAWNIRRWAVAMEFHRL